MEGRVWTLQNRVQVAEQGDKVGHDVGAVSRFPIAPSPLDGFRKRTGRPFAVRGEHQAATGVHTRVDPDC
jgi:hypothetical protein